MATDARPLRTYLDYAGFRGSPQMAELEKWVVARPKPAADPDP